MNPDTGDAFTDALVPVAVRLSQAVHDCDQGAVSRALLAARAMGREQGRGKDDVLSALLVVLAAMVPPDRSVSELLTPWKAEWQWNLRQS